MRTLLIVAAVIVQVGCTDRPPENKKRKAMEEAFYNPVDKKSYVASGGWKTYEPAVPRVEEPSKKVVTDHIRLLTAQNEIAARTTVEELASFIKEAERLAEESLCKSEKQFRLMVQFNCSKDGHEVKLALQGDAPQHMIHRYYDTLTSTKKLTVKDGQLAFQLEMSVRP